jgi:tetratricopeptide (TPR) repeat protein
MFSSKNLNRAAIYLTVATIASSSSFAFPSAALAQSPDANPPINANRTRRLQRQLNRQCLMPVYAQIKSDEAINNILKELSSTPASDANSQRLGNGYLAIGRYGEAIGMYQRSVTYTISQKLFGPSGQSEIGAYSGVGNAYLGLGGYQKAEAAYLKMFEAHSRTGGLSNPPIAPGSYRYTQLGSALLAQGKFEAASDAYQKGLALESSRSTKSDLRINQANLEYFTKGPAVAIATYNEELSAQSPLWLNNVVALNNRGLAHQALGQIEPAAASYNTAITIFSKAGSNGAFHCQWQTFSNYGRLLAQQGKTNEAIVYYRRATEVTDRIWQTSLPTLGQDDQLAYRQMVGPIYQEFAVLLLKQGQFDEAVKLMNSLYAPVKASQPQPAQILR